MSPDATKRILDQTPSLSTISLEEVPVPPYSQVSSASVSNTHRSDGEEREVAKREFSRILLLFAAFLSSIPLVTNTIPSQYSLLIHLTISTTALSSLGQVLGERLIASISLAATIILSLIDIYTGGNLIVFVSVVIVTSLGTMLFILATMLHNADESRNVPIQGSKLFVMATMLLKALLNHEIIPMSEDSGPATMNDLQRAFFAEAFILLIMALMLHASGVPILSPIRRASFNLVPNNRAAIIASVLYWAGAMVVAANVAITVIVASAETPIVIKVAGAIFAVCAAAIVFKAPTNPEDQ